MDFSFLKKLGLPKFSFNFLARKPSRMCGIDIGAHSTKVVQLRYEKERAILETYGELINEGYFKGGGSGGGWILKHLDADCAALIKDIMTESHVTTTEIVASIPASSSFVTMIPFSRILPKEIEAALPFEARKYIPIPMSEVVLDHEIIGSKETEGRLEVLLGAVPKEIVEKFKRVAGLAGCTLRSLEIETFSCVRSLVGSDQTPTAIVNIGHLSTNLVIVDRGKIHVSHNFSHGSHELTNALERGLAVNTERAETIKREIGLSDRIEEREMVSIIAPLVEATFSEIERLISIYNRKAPRTIQKINLTGGGSNLKGIIDYASTKFGIEVTRGNPFSRVVTPAFMQPILRDIGPGFAVAVGLALREITSS